MRMTALLLSPVRGMSATNRTIERINQTLQSIASWGKKTEAVRISRRQDDAQGDQRTIHLGGRIYLQESLNIARQEACQGCCVEDELHPWHTSS